MFKAVIWDFGGVITSSPFEAFNRYEEAHGLPRDLIRRINSINPDSNAWARFERSEIDATEFDQAFADEARAIGYDIRGSVVLPLLAGTIRPRVVAALDRVKAAGYRTGCITNNAPTGHGAGMSTSPEQEMLVRDVMARFDVLIESSREGVRKPDPRIYRIMCERLGVEPSVCVYLDDLGINCKPAAALGMATIKVTGEADVLDGLARLLDIRFD